MTKVILFVFLVLPGHQPIPYHEEVASLDECLGEARWLLEGATLRENGSLQAGCILVREPAQET